MKKNQILILSAMIIILSGIGIFSRLKVANDKCFSCKIEVKSLDKPIELSGKWLFNKWDNYNHRFPERDVSDWKLLDVPGDWSAEYNRLKAELEEDDDDFGIDIKFSVGWYRGVFEFDESLIGEEVVFLMDSYISKVNVYLDGIEIFKREGRDTYQKFYSIQPIPIKFRITKKKHTIAFKVDSILMKGVYQQPFQLRKASELDYRLSLIYLWGSTLREFIGIFLFIFGLFFVMIYQKTKYKNYLYAGYTGVASFPFFILTSDSFFKFFDSQAILILHYTSLFAMAAASNLFAQRFYKEYKRFNKLLYVVTFLNFAIFVGLTFKFHPDVFLVARKAAFVMAFAVGLHALYIMYKAVLIKIPGMIHIYFGYLIFLLTSTHDLFLALGAIQSVAMIFIGYFVATCSIIVYVMLHFANTFVKNKELINNLTELTDTLEMKVEKRTNELIDTNKRLIQMAHRAGMAEIATGILHDIGNVINSIGVLDEKIKTLLYESQIGTLSKLNNLLFVENREKFDALIDDDKLKKTIPDAYLKLETVLTDERTTIESYAQRLGKSVESVKNIVLSQQEYAKYGGLSEKVNVESLINDALMVESELIKSSQVKVITDFNADTKVAAHKNKLFHVIVNLIKNGIEALNEVPLNNREITIKTVEDSNSVRVSVRDNGMGIESEAMSKIFEHGYTTKQTGNGFGLHASSNAMVEMGGELQAKSEGGGKGAEFVVILKKSA